MANTSQLISKLAFSAADIAALLRLRAPHEVEELHRHAFDLATAVAGNKVHLRGIIEFSNICARDCFYCGIRKSNRNVDRYCLDISTLVECARWAAEVGYGSCVIQSGERSDPKFTQMIEDFIIEIKAQTRSADLPDGLGITLSVGEQSPATYRRWFAAGATRYLLRIESSNPEIFQRIHPPAQSFAARLQALADLREAGFQVGTGVMIGIPGQTAEDLRNDILFFKRNDIDMIGMGPYIVHPDSPMREAGMLPKDDLLRLALNMVAATRIVLRDVNIAATTALQAIAPDGRERAIACGANIVMPNITPKDFRKNYQLYSGKPCIDEDSHECRNCLKNRIESVGRQIGWNEWGDSAHYRSRIRWGGDASSHR